jgi:uncharacterized membrane protein required for colicin V production
MKINSKNLIIMLLMFFLISNQIIGVAWGIIKTFLYCSVFLFVLKGISPELYNYIMKLFSLDELKLSNIPSSIINIVKKIKNLIPFFKNKDENKSKITQEITSESS